MKTAVGSAQLIRTLRSVAIVAAIITSFVSPLYQPASISAAPVITPKNLGFSNANGSHDCGLYTNISSITQEWDAAPGASSYNYKATLPNGTTYGPINIGNVTNINTVFDTEGVLSFSVQSVYDGDVTSEWADACSATYDVTKPAISSNIAPNASLGKTVNIIETVTETNPLAYAVRILDAASNPVVVNGKGLGASTNPATSNTLSYEWDTTKVADGPYKLQLSARDKADNAESITIDITVDNTMPGTTIDAYPLPISKVAPTISGSVDDNNTTIQVTINETTYSTIPSGNRWSITTNPLPDGTYAITAIATDAAGNATTPPASGSISIDTTAPSTIITSPVSGLVTRGDVQINGTISELATYQLVINGTVVQSGSASDISYTWSTNGLASGTYLVTLTGTDTAGNAASDSVSITIDNTAPAIPTRTSPTNGSIGTSTSTPALSWIAATDISSPVVYSVQIASDAGLGNILASTDTTNTNMSIGAYNDGTYFWRIQACDALGNCSDWSPAWQFTIDDTAPTITVDESDTTDTTPTITGTVNDPGAIVTIKVSGITYAAVVSTIPNAAGTYNWSADTKRTLSIGAHSMTVFAKDSLGNSVVYGGAITITRSTSGSGDVISQLAADAAALGDSDQTGVVNQNKASTNDNKSDSDQSNFLKLGWWWLPLILAVAGATYIGYYYRSTK